jgi:diacylglycerol kinase (ATP)
VDKIPVIINPAARSAKASSRMEAIQELSPRIELCPTSGPGDARIIAAELTRAGTPIIVAAGGDGTINEVVNGIRDAGPNGTTALGLLPSGTMNVFSVELGLPAKDLVECWRVIEKGERRAIDLWELNDHAFVQLAGIGLDAEIIKETTWESKKALGPLSYVISAAQLIGKAAPQVKVLREGREPLLGSVVLVGNGKRYGGPLKVFPQANNQDGLLDVVVLRRHSYGKVFAALLSLLLTGYDRRSEDLEYFQTKELRIEADGEIPVEADGELIPCDSPITIRKCAEPLWVVA